MNTTKIYYYKGNFVTFKITNGNVMINATEMARMYTTKAESWLKTESAKKVIIATSASLNISASNLVQVVTGKNAGTWIHEDVALIYAQRLSPKFYQWCNIHVTEIVRNAVISMKKDKSSMQESYLQIRILKEYVMGLEEQDGFIGIAKRILSQPKIS